MSFPGRRVCADLSRTRRWVITEYFDILFPMLGQHRLCVGPSIGLMVQVGARRGKRHNGALVPLAF